MTKYLTTLIEEKGHSIHEEITIDGHFGITYKMLIDFVAQMTECHANIRKTLVKIDFCNGDVFDYLGHLANGMVASCGY